MSARIIATLIGFAAIATNARAEQTPAWQEPGYVMEEVVVTARAPEPPVTPAWQEPGYVMEEVVVTAPMPATGTDAQTDTTDTLAEARDRSVLEYLLVLHRAEKRSRL